MSEKNANAASIYVVALEIDLRLSPGAQLLVSLAEEHGGKLKVVDTEKLIELKKINRCVGALFVTARHGT